MKLLNGPPQFGKSIADWRSEFAKNLYFSPNQKRDCNCYSLKTTKMKLLPVGMALWEIHGLTLRIDRLPAYSQKAFCKCCFMAEIQGKLSCKIVIKQTARCLCKKINYRFLGSAIRFHTMPNFIGTGRRYPSLKLIGAIIRADTFEKPWAVAELQATKAKYPTLQKTKQGFYSITIG